MESPARAAPGQSITCRLIAKEGQQTLVIQDEGVGIAADVLPRVFDLFFTTRSQGVGLGLALCKKIIELHQGTITIDSEDNRGTSVRLDIPLHYHRIAE